MQIQELIRELQKFDPKDEVRIAQPTHDYWQNIVAVAPTFVTHEAVFTESGLVSDDDGEEPTIYMVVIA